MALATAPRPDVDVSTTLTARAAAVMAVLAAVAALFGLPVDGIGSAGPGDLRLLSGSLEQRVDGAWVPVALNTNLPAGTWVRTDTAVAALGRPGTTIRLAPDSEIVVEPTVDLQRGTVLVDSEVRASVTTGLLHAHGRGVWRVDAGQTARVATYEAATEVTDGAGRELLLRRYEQVAAIDGAVGEDAAPITYVVDDPFDATYLADALTIDDFLDALARGLRADYGEEPQRLAFYRDFDGLDGVVAETLAALADGTLAEVGDDGRLGPPDRILVAGVVSQAVAEARRIDGAEAAAEVRAARLAGAAWGLIAVTNDVRPVDVRAAADRALTQRRERVASGDAAPVDRASQVPDSDGDRQPGQPPTTPDTEPPPEEPTDEDDDGTVGESVDPVVDELPDEVGEPADEAVDLVDDLIGGAAEVAGALLGN